MKKILTILFLVVSFTVFSQVSNTKVVRIANDATAFGQALPEGTILVNLATDSLYLILTPVAANSMLQGLSRDTQYRSLLAIQDISGIATNEAAITTINTSLTNKLEKNASITSATKTKITFDADGLVTSADDATTTDIAEGSNLYYTEARVSTNTNVAANTLARHNEVSLGTANGLSLSGQQVSMAVATSSNTGTLSSSDWNTFNNKISTEIDGDETNELQTIEVAELSGTKLKLSLSDEAVTHEIELSSLTGVSQTASDSSFVWVAADTVFVDHINTKDSTEIKINENLAIEADGTIRMDNEATVWRDELQPLIGQKLDNRKSSIRYDDDEFTVIFDKKDVDYLAGDGVVMNIQLNHDWDGITPVEPHLHWFQSSNKVPNWLIAYRWHQNGQAKDTDWTELAYSGDGSAFDYSSGTILQITGFPSISPPTSPTGVSSILQLKLMRDLDNDSNKFSGDDPLNADSHALSFDIHIKINTMGSRTEYSK